MLRNLRPVLPEATVVWRKLHDRESSVACTLLFRGGPAREPQAAFSGVRVWEKTWLAQHFGALATADRRATGTLAAGVRRLRHAAAGHALHGVLRARGERADERVPREVPRAHRNARVGHARDAVALDAARRSPSAGAGRAGGAGRGRLGPELRPIEQGDEVVVSRAAERELGVMAASALSLLPRRVLIAGDRAPVRARSVSSAAARRG